MTLGRPQPCSPERNTQHKAEAFKPSGACASVDNQRYTSVEGGLPAVRASYTTIRSSRPSTRSTRSSANRTARPSGPFASLPVGVDADLGAVDQHPIDRNRTADELTAGAASDRQENYR